MRVVGGWFPSAFGRPRGEVVQCAVGSVGVVFGARVLGEDLGFEQTTEGCGDQKFVAEASTEGFAVPVSRVRRA